MRSGHVGALWLVCDFTLPYLTFWFPVKLFLHQEYFGDTLFLSAVIFSSLIARYLG